MRNIEFVRQIRINNHQNWIDIKYRLERLEYWYELENELENRLSSLDSKFTEERKHIQIELEYIKRFIEHSKTIIRYLRKLSKINISIG